MSCTFSPETIDAVIAFHGHTCPGLAIGIRAAELALDRFEKPSKDEELVAITETDMCGVDAIQFLTGCTYGKGNLIHRDYGKSAFSFYDRNTGTGFRAVLDHGVGADLRQEMQELRGKNEKTASEAKRLKEIFGDLKDLYMSLPLEKMFSVSELPSRPPRPAVILDSLACAECGEMTMESRTRQWAGKTLCIPCFKQVEQKR